jgi:2-C-methyl-D-erythritol 2,4-cyclodiphosphate synthase
MINYISADLDLTPEQVNIKAKTNESLGWEGRQEGIGAQAIVLVHIK